MAMLASTVSAQIGGHFASNGTFALDDFEDLDLVADSVNRLWVPTAPLKAESPTSSGLILDSQQTPLGAVHFILKERFSFIDGSLGVPLPSEQGLSTLTHPADISDFQTLKFRLAHDSDYPNGLFAVTLECYPRNADLTFPKIRWEYTATPGDAYQDVFLPLHNPTLIENNPSSIPVEELLAKCRFIAWYFFSAPVPAGSTASFHIDDIVLEGVASVNFWSVYD